MALHATRLHRAPDFLPPLLGLMGYMKPLLNQSVTTQVSLLVTAVPGKFMPMSAFGRIRPISALRHL